MAVEIVHSVVYTTTSTYQSWTPSFTDAQSGDLVVGVVAVTNFTGSTSNFNVFGLEGGVGTFGWNGSDGSVWSELWVTDFDSFDGVVGFSQNSGQAIEAALLVCVVRGVTFVYEGAGASGPSTGAASSPVTVYGTTAYDGQLVPFQSAMIYGGSTGLVSDSATFLCESNITLSGYPYSLSLALGDEYNAAENAGALADINLLHQDGTFGTSWEWFSTGFYFRTTAVTPTTGPTAHLTSNVASGTAPLTVTFSGESSTAGDAPIVSYAFETGGEVISTTTTGNEVLYATPGTYSVTLTVTDENGLSDIDTVTITVTSSTVITTIDPTSKFLDALRYSHRAYVRAVLRTPDCQTYDLPVVDGSITIDRNSKTRRSADLTVAIDQLGTDSRDALERVTVQSGEVEIHTGITYEDGTTEELLIARMRVDSLELQDSASARIGLFDYALMLDEHPVDTAMGAKIPAGTDWRIAIQQLIEDTFTWKPCGWDNLLTIDPEVPSWQIPEQAWDNVNRLSTILEWAEARECDFYNLPDGRFHLAPKTDDGDPVWTVDSGDYGVLVTATQKFAREEQYNAVAISYQVPDGDIVSIRAFVVDDDPNSPTRWGGPFGKRVLTLDNIPAANEDEARSIAVRKLNENKGATRALSLKTLRNPALLPGQVIVVQHPQITNERQVIERVVHQLGRGTSDIDCTLSRT